jgi:hypothetical protein
MHAPSFIEATANYRRQELLQEAARERLASQVNPRNTARRNGAHGHLFARAIIAAVVVVASIAPTVGGAPAYASSDAAGVDINSVYQIATANGLDVVAKTADDDAPVIQSGASDDSHALWRFQPTTAPDGTTQYEIVNLTRLNKCLSVYYNSTSAGGQIVVYECHAWADQLWRLSPHGALVTIQSVSSGLYLDVPGDSAAWGTQLIQNRDAFGAPLLDEYFGLVRYSTIQTSPAVYRLTTAWSLALDVVSNDNDARVVQSGVSIGRLSQEWSFIRQSDGLYELRNVGSGRCLSVYYNSLQSGAGLVQYDCQGWADQKWQVVAQNLGGASISLRSLSSKLVVDVPGGTPVIGTQLDQWSITGGTNQLFTLTLL